jgi:hypothetical protein
MCDFIGKCHINVIFFQKYNRHAIGGIKIRHLNEHNIKKKKKLVP